MDSNYWVQFWESYTENLEKQDEQSQVLRTLNKKPITESLWKYTLTKIDENFKVNENDKVLDLCSGNGLLSRFFADKGAYVTAVDVSENLLKPLNKLDNIDTINADVRSLNFQTSSFNKIIIYAGIQYFSHKESIEIIQKCFSWLKSGGELFIGDIPDESKKWSFFNTPQRRQVYFDNVLKDKAIVGTWFDKEWFENVIEFIGFSKGEYLLQDEKLIYSNFRYDFKCIK